MLTAINPVALPALRIAATFFLVINLLGGMYVFLNRHRFFDRDPMWTTIFRPFASCGSRSLCSLGWV